MHGTQANYERRQGRWPLLDQYITNDDYWIPEVNCITNLYTANLWRRIYRVENSNQIIGNNFPWRVITFRMNVNSGKKLTDQNCPHTRSLKFVLWRIWAHRWIPWRISSEEMMSHNFSLLPNECYGPLKITYVANVPNQGSTDICRLPMQYYTRHTAHEHIGLFLGSSIMKGAIICQPRLLSFAVCKERHYICKVDWQKT